MKYYLPFLIFVSFGCIKKTKSNFEEPSLIERDTGILNEEDLEALPEN
jgi:hypothetical protein